MSEELKRYEAAAGIAFIGDDRDAKTEIILITETATQSWLRDASTWVQAVALMVPGWYFDIPALTVAGFIIFWLMLFGEGWREAKMTVAQARAKLDEIEARK